jgi:acyl dehydratase/NADP-dependent 3-hydroxy acid dehydrogenase YdfG
VNFALSVSTAQSGIFANLSGDRNPIHIDSHAARRLQFGQTVVHGVHTFLAALDGLYQNSTIVGAISQCRVEFRAPLFQGQPLQILIKDRQQEKVFLACFAGGSEVMRCEVRTTQQELAEIKVPASPQRIAESQNLDSIQVASQVGAVECGMNLDVFSELFPSLATVVSARSFSSMLLGLTYVVGMVCPGRHSLMSSIQISRTDGLGIGNTGIRFAVRRFDEAYRLASIDVNGVGWAGVVKAFLRPAPTTQTEMAQVLARVPEKKWTGRTALVIGASRGLGEVAAKIVAASGGKVLITYHRGESDARAVANDINAHGGNASILQLDVQDKVGGALALIKEPLITDVLFFASPHIDQARSLAFDKVLFDAYIAAYVTSLDSILVALGDRLAADFGLFWPSSQYADHPPKGFAEYAAAKAAGEVFCNSLKFRYPKIAVQSPRLPPLRTDQTLSTIPVAVREPLEVLLDCLQEPLNHESSQRQS